MAFGWFSFAFLTGFSSSNADVYVTSSLARLDVSFHELNIHLS